MVPRARRTCGRATLVARDGRALSAPMRVLATASRAVARKHGNPTRDRSLPFGHPPAGTYLFAGSLPPGYQPKPRRARRFGSVGAILLAGDSGEARVAADKGRRLFFLHGGPSDRKGRLRPTRGGFRMLDHELTLLLRAINDAHASGDPLENIEVVDVLLPEPAAPADRALSRKRRNKRRQKREQRREQKGVTGSLGSPGGAPKEASLGGLAAIALASKLLGKRSTDARGPVSRRDVMALALLVGTVAGCCPEERPSSCEPVACDPDDASCKPSVWCYQGYGSGSGSGDTTADDSGGGG